MATPASASTGDADSSGDAELRMNCTGTPTTVPKIDGLYQTSCSLAYVVCDFVFDPCVIT